MTFQKKRSQLKIFMQNYMDEMDDKLRKKAINAYCSWKSSSEERKDLRKNIIHMIAGCCNVSLHELVEEECPRIKESQEKLEQEERKVPPPSLEHRPTQTLLKKADFSGQTETFEDLEPETNWFGRFKNTKQLEKKMHKKSLFVKTDEPIFIKTKEHINVNKTFPKTVDMLSVKKLSSNYTNKAGRNGRRTITTLEKEDELQNFRTKSLTKRNIFKEDFFKRHSIHKGMKHK